MSSDVSEKLLVRAERKSRKRQQKKDQIASSALEALQELGYANTSLRDIAEKANLSLGMLHYYFEDRTELILYCVTAYKTSFTSQLADAISGAEGREQVLDTLTNALANSIADDALIHRLWYDLRSQALFDPAFRPVVKDIERTLIDMVALAASRSGSNEKTNAEIGYALIDGLFRYQLQNQVTGTPRSRASLAEEMRAALDTFM
ncbi:TetR/AcrR family transcriptional regulator [Marinobacter sp. F4216]|uniref:TetR/AcrR family transcriptional regulator n=1 Tax=Marinobacter sp. F4216 TaxID=2874281 RepID=UPI001CBBC8F0|nr:TetR/AcrR family transcriptional regulator [Marinobacter sp. F4216]MBZ2168862.1 TetR/AcrR family transcriptional regulator [Marinobacter sp. F4216]